MPQIPLKVPYGYEPPIESNRGTLIYYDSFEHTSVEQLEAAAVTVRERSFASLVLYPIHEETMKRMSKETISAYHKRVKQVTAWVQEQERIEISIDGWEGKRKKYTPMDTALRHLTETLPSPHFLYLTPEMASLFASFLSFEEWIGRIRLILSSAPSHLHPRLEEYRHRWSLAESPE